MADLCDRVFPENRECSGAASMYEMGVSMFGGEGFQRAQRENCGCIEEGLVEENYKNILLTVYKEHSDRKEEEAAAILSKGKAALQGKTGEELAGVFYGVLKKYEAAIVHVGDRVGRRVPKPPEKKRKKAEKKTEKKKEAEL